MAVKKWNKYPAIAPLKTRSLQNLQRLDTDITAWFENNSKKLTMKLLIFMASFIALSSAASMPYNSALVWIFQDHVLVDICTAEELCIFIVARFQSLQQRCSPIDCEFAKMYKNASNISTWNLPTRVSWCRFRSDYSCNEVSIHSHTKPINGVN